LGRLAEKERPVTDQTGGSKIAGKQLKKDERDKSKKRAGGKKSEKSATEGGENEKRSVKKCQKRRWKTTQKTSGAWGKRKEHKSKK